MAQNELYHYGVLGMKWGVRKQEPHSKSMGYRYHTRAAKSVQRDADNLQKHGYKIEADAVKKVAEGHIQKANKSQRKYDAKREYHKTDEYKEKRKRTIKIGAAAAGTTLAVYGGYKFHKYIRTQNAEIAFNNGRKAVDNFFKSNQYKTLYDISRDYLDSGNTKEWKRTYDTMNKLTNEFFDSAYDKTKNASFRRAVVNVLNEKVR